MTVASSALPRASGAERLSPDNPWPGLVPFRFEDRDFFKGRERETEHLRRLIRRERLTVLFGKSGLGKSSLIQAGLFPSLRAENVLPVYLRIDYSGTRSPFSEQVKSAIGDAAAARGVEAPSSIDRETLWEYLHRQDADFWSPRNRPLLPLLVFDQFEEIFTLGKRDPARIESTDEILIELESLVEGAPPPGVLARLDANPEEAERYLFDRHFYRVVLSLREDFLPELESLRQRMGSIGRNRFRLRPMGGAAATEVVRQVPDLIDEETAERVVRFVAADDRHRAPTTGGVQVEPALLSIVCRELNNRRREVGQSKITTDLLDQTGSEILEDFYDRAVFGLSGEVRKFIEEELLTVSGERDSVALENALSVSGITPEVLDDLQQRRLVRREHSGGRQRLELTHDRLTGVIAASRDRRRLEERQRAEAESREKAEKAAREARRQRNIFLGLLVLAVAGLAVAFWAYTAMNSAQERRRNTVRAQLESGDSRTVVRAFEELVDGLGEDVDRVVARISSDYFASHQRFVELYLDLDWVATGEAEWLPEARDALSARLGATDGRRAPTREEDQTLNRRIRLEGGRLTMAARKDGDGKLLEKTVTLSPFLIQAHEVTNAEFRRFSPGHDGQAPDDHPAVNLDWYDAMAYAAWLGGSLPTEAQWEFAARGDEGRSYPWGEEAPSCSRAHSAGCAPEGQPVAVMSLGAGRTGEGLFDLAGNVWEWCLDRYGDYSGGQERDPRGPESGEQRVMRGGSFTAEEEYLRGSHRGSYRPEWKDADLGFRVAWRAGPDEN